MAGGPGIQGNCGTVGLVKFPCICLYICKIHDVYI